MMMMSPRQTTAKPLILVLLAISLFLLATQFRLPPSSRMTVVSEGQVVISAPIQVLMYAGDRFLAANIEAMRVAAIGPGSEEILASYRIRAHQLVAELNPCHEDNIYLANAMLGWGGAVNEANSILQDATECRHWDAIPPFILGFNRYFFHRDIEGAIKALDIAIARSSGANRASMQRLSISISARQFNDEKMAAAYLRNQRDEATDQLLVDMLNRRILRLDGLISLREAQARFEKNHGRPLTNPDELISSGTIEAIPQDPMKLGYEFIDGHFRLRSRIIGGQEIR